jgi:hypothetical protein
MKIPVLPMMGAALFVIVTIVDVFLITLPMSMYISALLAGSALILTVFSEDMPFLVISDHDSRHK